MQNYQNNLNNVKQGGLSLSHAMVTKIKIEDVVSSQIKSIKSHKLVFIASVTERVEALSFGNAQNSRER